MRLPYRDEVDGVDVAIVGAPFDGGTSYRPGARMAPREIRAQSSLIRPYNYFQKIAPFEHLRVIDAGDIDASPVNLQDAYRAIEDRIATIAAARAVPMVVGGDHSISLPVLRALARAHGPLGLVQFDSHIDTWDQDFGSPYFHGSPFWHAVREGAIDPRRFIQVGIRGPMYGENDFAFHREHAVTVRDITQVKERGVASIAEEIRQVVTGPCYVTFDIDAVDPAFAPGTGTPEVGGLTSDEALRLVRGLAGASESAGVGPGSSGVAPGSSGVAPGSSAVGPGSSGGVPGAAAALGCRDPGHPAGLYIVGCDVVEVSPLFDGPGQITALLAANIMFELLGVIARRPGHGNR